MAAEPILWLTLAVMLVGLVGSVLPALPGVPLIFVAALVYAYWKLTGESEARLDRLYDELSPGEILLFGPGQSACCYLEKLADLRARQGQGRRDQAVGLVPWNLGSTWQGGWTPLLLVALLAQEALELAGEFVAGG